MARLFLQTNCKNMCCAWLDDTGSGLASVRLVAFQHWNRLIVSISSAFVLLSIILLKCTTARKKVWLLQQFPMAMSILQGELIPPF